MAPLILKRAPIVWNQNDFDVLEDGVIVGRIFLSPGAPQDRPWMWASGHNGDIKRAAYGYEPTSPNDRVRPDADTVTALCAFIEEV